MSANLKSYLKSAFIQFLVSLIFPVVVFALIRDKELIAIVVFMDVVGLIPGYYRYKDAIRYEQRLKAKGLTLEDLSNIEFAKNWYSLRKRGIIKYTIVDGGVFFGLFLSLVFGCCTLFINGVLDYVKADPNNMFNFVGLSYLAGAMSGLIIYRFRWIYNEQKFIRLTDPLN